MGSSNLDSLACGLGDTVAVALPGGGRHLPQLDGDIEQLQESLEHQLGLLPRVAAHHQAVTCTHQYKDTS